MNSYPANVRPKDDAALAACLMAVDPSGLGGVSVRSAYGPAIERYLKQLRGLLPLGAPFRRVPPNITDSRLLGGLDLAATLQAGRPVLESGLLAEANGGCIVLPMAERLPLTTATRLCSVLDSKEVAVERDGFGCRNASHIAVIALDEGASGDERPPAALLDRLALHLSLEAARHDDDFDPPFNTEQITMARSLLPEVTAGDSMFGAFCRTAAAIGIGSLRAPIFAMKVARVHAALAGRRCVMDEDSIAAARLVLAPRMTVLPEPENVSPGKSSDQDQQQDAPGTKAPDSEADDERSTAADNDLQNVVLAAACAAVPAHLLALLQTSNALRSSSTSSGRADTLRQSPLRGRPIGARRGELKAGARLNVVETLRAAAPWQ